MFLLTILISIIILSIVVIVHEWGHFLACRVTATKVKEFGLGYPPRAMKLFKRQGTIFSLNWIPFGGFNRILGEEEASQDVNAFNNKTVWQRIFINSAGILANFIFAWLILTIWFLVLSSATLHNHIVVTEVISGSVAEKAGLKIGDLIISAEDQEIKKSEELTQFTQKYRNQEVNFVIGRSGKKIEQKIHLSDNQETPLGIGMAETGGEFPKIAWWKAPYEAMLEIGRIIAITFYYLYKLVLMPFGGERIPFQLSGPVGIVAFSTQIISLGWIYLLRLIAIISLGLGISNLLPIPAADGGHLFFRSLELIRGRRVLKHEHESAIHYLGFILLLILLVVITYHDVVKFIVR